MKFFPGTCNVLFPAGEGVGGGGAPFMKSLDCLFQAFSVYNIKYGCEDCGCFPFCHFCCCWKLQKISILNERYFFHSLMSYW